MDSESERIEQLEGRVRELELLLEATRRNIGVNFKFPEGCKEDYSCSEVPALPRVGEFIQGEKPGSGRYRISAIVYSIDAGQERTSAIVLELDALDKINL